MSRASGISEETLAALHTYETSDLFTPLEKAAIDLAVAMSSMPADVPAELRDRLLRELTPGQFMELVSAIAWENHRARVNRALDVRPMGFSDGAFCLLPQRQPPVL